MGGRGIKSVCQACILVRPNGLEVVPNAMALVRVVVAQVVLGFEWARIQPFWWQWFVLLVSVPLA